MHQNVFINMGVFSSNPMHFLFLVKKMHFLLFLSVLASNRKILTKAIFLQKCLDNFERWPKTPTNTANFAIQLNKISVSQILEIFHSPFQFSLKIFNPVPGLMASSNIYHLSSWGGEVGRASASEMKPTGLIARVGVRPI
jgi:hypothetical protein